MPKTSKKPTKTKDRGKLLTTLLVIGIVINIIALVSLPFVGNTASQGKPDWYINYTLLEVILGIIVISQVWNWQKWAVYLTVVSDIVSIIINFIIIDPHNTGGLIFSLGLTFLVWYAIFRKWKYFV